MARITYALRTHRFVELIVAMREDPENIAAVERWNRLTQEPGDLLEFMRLYGLWQKIHERAGRNQHETR